MRRRETHANEMRNEGIEDVTIHHAALEAFLMGERLIRVQRVHILTAPLETVVNLLAHLIDM